MKSHIPILVSIGSNAPQKHRIVENTLQWLAEFLVKSEISPVYETECFGDSNAPHYLNAVVGGYSDLSPEDLIALFKQRELQEGRERGSDIVLIDIDLIAYGDTVVRPNEIERPYFLIGYYKLKNFDILKL